MIRYCIRIISLIMIFSLFSCFGFSAKEKITHYYTLEYSAPKIEGLKTLPFSILIERFQVTPLYDSNKIIYRDAEYTREAYRYHSWRTNPGDIVTYLLARDFKETSLFKAVFTMDSRFPSTHVLKGVVEEFYEQDGDEYWEGVLSLSVTLIKKNEIDPMKSIIFQKKYNMKEVCSAKNPKSLAEAMSHAMEKLSILIIKDIHSSMLK